MCRSSILLLALLTSPLFGEERTQPNVVVVFTDDHGYADLSSQGVHDDVRTPHIDALAKAGVRMTHGYVTAPQCVPSRAGLLSGRYQNRFGVESNGKPLDGFDDALTIAERLQKAGYATGMTGKWHLGPSSAITEHGFDHVYAKNANRPGWANFELDGSDREPGPEQSKLYHIDANTAAACGFIDRHHDAPFFFYCAYRAPHVPLDAPRKYLDRFRGEMPERRRQCLAMLSAVDDGVGRIVARLKAHGIVERTLIFVIGDNGAPLKIHKLDAPGGGPGWDGSLNDPLNGEKGMLTEGGIRVPFVVAWPGHIPGGRTDATPVISLDVAATALAAAELPVDAKLDGVNLLPFLGGRAKPPERTLYWRWIAQSAAREGRWKYLRGGNRAYLFDVVADPEEEHDLLARHPEIAKRLEDRLHDWAGELDPPGLAVASASKAWERYFDHYLDGKPAARPTDTGPRGENRIAGWVVRGGTAERRDGRLAVRPGERGRTFLAHAGLDLAPPLTAVVRLRSRKPGRVGIAWREQGQKDFPAGMQTAFAETKPTDELANHEIPVAAKGRVIHVRLLLPDGGTDIASIEFQDANGRSVKSWRFDR